MSIMEKRWLGFLGGPTNTILALWAVLFIQLWLSGRSYLYSLGFRGSRTDTAWAFWAVLLRRLELSGRSYWYRLGFLRLSSWYTGRGREGKEKENEREGKREGRGEERKWER